jgi:hypothetical protein
MSLKERLLKYWFIVSSVIIGAMYFLIDNRNKRLAKAVADAQTSQLAGKLEEIKKRSSESGEEYEKAKQDYESLKRQHADLITKLGIGPRKK